MIITPRQREILLTVARTGSSRAAADELGISLQSVKNQLTNIHRAYGVRSTMAALYLVLGEPWTA